MKGLFSHSTRKRAKHETQRPLASVGHVLAALRRDPGARIVADAAIPTRQGGQARRVHELVIPGAFAPGVGGCGGFACALVEPSVVQAMVRAGQLADRGGRYFLAGEPAAKVGRR
jgi:hypothetical protein